jgi:type 1 glutamine amidotransferase
LLAGAVALACGVGFPASSDSRPTNAIATRILVFSKTAGFRHDSIPVAVQTLRTLGPANGLTVDATEDASAFTDGNLSRYAAVVFLLTSGDVLEAAQQAAFERYIQGGGGFAGVHSAADTEYDWPFYGRLVGAYFRTHPAVQPAVVDVQERRDPSTAGLPGRWRRTDEWYAFARKPRPSVAVLASVDEATYSPGDAAMGADHPIAWRHVYRGGRAWYTAMGHGAESYAEPLFRRHLLGGIRYAAGLSPPRIVSLRTAVRQRRVSVSLRYASCTPCAGRVRVRGRSTALRLRAGIGEARSGVLRRGHATAVVVLTDPVSDVSRTASRRVVIR